MIKPVHSPHILIRKISHHKRIETLDGDIDPLFIDRPRPRPVSSARRDLDDLIDGDPNRKKDKACDRTDDTIIRHGSPDWCCKKRHPEVMQVVDHIWMPLTESLDS
jgi:hypothetical protein